MKHDHLRSNPYFGIVLSDTLFSVLGMLVVLMVLMSPNNKNKEYEINAKTNVDFLLNFLNPLKPSDFLNKVNEEKKQIETLYDIRKKAAEAAAERLAASTAGEELDVAVAGVIGTNTACCLAAAAAMTMPRTICG